MKSRNKDEKLKSDAIQKHEEHLSLSIKQRSDYQTRCKNSQSIVENANITDIPNNVKTDRRSSLSRDRLDVLLRISEDGPFLEKFNPDASIDC